MKNNFIILIILPFFLFINNKSSISQNSPLNGSVYFPNLSCGTENQNINFTYPFFPMNNDTLKALVVFCNFPSPSGNFDFDGCYLQHWSGQNAQSKPVWADSIICQNTYNLWDPSLTGYFKVSSLNKFWLIGDVYPDLYVFNGQVNDYSDNNKRIGFAVKELLQSIDKNVDFNNYDKFDPFDYDYDGNKREPDGMVDFIFIIFRFTNSQIIDPSLGAGYSGIACLGGRDGRFGIENGNPITEIFLDGKKIKAGCNGSGCISELTNKWNIGIPIHEFAEHYGYGLDHSETMGAFNINGGGIASAYDREHFEWNITSAIIPTTNSTIVLRDYITTNDYIKLPRSTDTIFVENRRRKNYYSSLENHNWKWSCNDPLTPVQPDSMILIYRNFYYRSFFIQSAFGNWSWEKCLNKYKVDYYSPIYNYFFQDYPERYNEYSSTFFLRKVSALNLKCEQNNLPSQISYMGVNGDKNTCFDLEYNDVYSPWSNPSLPILNSNDSLTIEVIERNENGDIVLNIYLNNITNSKPSKPTGLKIYETEIIPDLSFHPTLKWIKNLEPDFDGIYNIYRGSSFDINEEPQYLFLTQICNTNNLVEYIDNEVVLYYNTQYVQSCESNYMSYFYKISAVDIENKESVKSDKAAISGWSLDCIGTGDNIINSDIKIEMFQNYPNPYNSNTNIRYIVYKNGNVNITIYDVLGRKVENILNETKEKGSYIVSYNSKNLSSGIYFYIIETKEYKVYKKMIILK